jgi:hypothetical protein
VAFKSRTICRIYRGEEKSEYDSFVFVMPVRSPWRRASQLAEKHGVWTPYQVLMRPPFALNKAVDLAVSFSSDARDSKLKAQEEPSA